MGTCSYVLTSFADCIVNQANQQPGMLVDEMLVDAKAVGPIHCTLVPLCIGTLIRTDQLHL